MITWDTLVEMTEGLAFANDIRRRRQSAQDYRAFQGVMTKLTEAENEVRTLTGGRYFTLRQYQENKDEILRTALDISKFKIREYLNGGSCPHVLDGAAPCRACIESKRHEIDAEAFREACQQQPKSFGRTA
jgi:hypothetical protein